MSADSGRPVGSVARALALLDALAEEPAGVNALARRIGVNPSSASRLLATLERGGLVEREPGGPYRLGLHLVALADRVLARLDVRDLARPQLRALVERTGETATLSVPGGSEAVTVDFVPGAASVVSMARLGRPSIRSEEHTSELQSLTNLVCRLLLEKKKNNLKTCNRETKKIHNKIQKT